MKFSKTAINGIVGVWNNIAADVAECVDPHDMDNLTALEMCLDADRLKMFGFTKAAEEFDRLLEDYDYQDVLQELNDVLTLV